jgi:hypothetical protein
MGYAMLIIFIGLLILAVSPQANLTEPSINNTYYQGSTATLVCTSLGGPNNTYQWWAKETDIIGETAETLTLPNVTASTGGMYTCIVSNTAGNHSASTFVFIHPYFEVDPSDQQTSVGSCVVLVCDAVAFPSPEYLWQRLDGESISSNTVTERNLSITSVQYGDEGEYFCNASVRGITIQSRNGLITGNGILIVSLSTSHNTVDPDHYSEHTNNSGVKVMSCVQ